LRILDRGILFANGIAFGPDDALYANASFTGEVYRYDVFETAKPRREVFGNVLQPFEGDDFRGPDGMCWGDDGRLYCTVYGQRNVTVLNKDGSLATRLLLDGEKPTNCAFALSGKTLLVTEVELNRVEQIATLCGGLSLYYPQARVAPRLTVTALSSDAGARPSSATRPSDPTMALRLLSPRFLEKPPDRARPDSGPARRRHGFQVRARPGRRL
jgi:hypothetical protein